FHPRDRPWDLRFLLGEASGISDDSDDAGVVPGRLVPVLVDPLELQPVARRLILLLGVLVSPGCPAVRRVHEDLVIGVTGSRPDVVAVLQITVWVTYRIRGHLAPDRSVVQRPRVTQTVGSTVFSKRLVRVQCGPFTDLQPEHRERRI